jgi:hypothetical protein
MTQKRNKASSNILPGMMLTFKITRLVTKRLYDNYNKRLQIIRPSTLVFVIGAIKRVNACDRRVDVVFVTPISREIFVLRGVFLSEVNVLA